MKKIFSVLLLSLLLANYGFCTENTSENAFLIRIDEVPPGSPNSPKSGGLSGGAITAIALGSVFGGLGAIGGLTYFFLHNGAQLAQGIVTGASSPICTICINESEFLAKLKLNTAKYNYLIKAIENNQIKTCNTSRYLVVEDTIIKNKTFNSVIFELPAFEENSTVNVKLTQISDPFTLNGKIPSLDSKFLQTNDTKKSVEYPMYISKMDSNSGVLIKQGQITLGKNKTAVIATSFDENLKNATPQKYALLVEFSK